jgi:hypothetical protein
VEPSRERAPALPGQLAGRFLPIVGLALVGDFEVKQQHHHLVRTASRRARIRGTATLVCRRRLGAQVVGAARQYGHVRQPNCLARPGRHGFRNPQPLVEKIESQRQSCLGVEDHGQTLGTGERVGSVARIGGHGHTLARND